MPSEPASGSAALDPSVLDPSVLDPSEVAALRRLLDREAVVDCVLRYARGLDRGDEELLRSAYHDDALEDHGAYVGGVDGLVAFLAAAHGRFPGYQRYVTNFVVELDGGPGDGATAHCESSYLCVLRRPGAATDAGAATDRLLANGGRYVDRLERRDGAWRILRRVVVTEWEGTIEGGTPRFPSEVVARRDRDDVSYDRPLEVTRDHRSPF